RWGDRLPRLPEGDLVVLGEAAGRAAVAGSGSIAGVERMLRAWPVAGAATLLLVITLGMALFL
ncbi:MAG: hypothetical protein AB7X49_11165, partial [Geminicoccaceae bacterium]